MTFVLLWIIHDCFASEMNNQVNHYQAKYSSSTPIIKIEYLKPGEQTAFEFTKNKISMNIQEIKRKFSYAVALLLFFFAGNLISSFYYTYLGSLLHARLHSLKLPMYTFWMS